MCLGAARHRRKQIQFVFFKPSWKSSHVPAQSERSVYYVFEYATMGPVVVNSIDSTQNLELLRPIMCNHLFGTVRPVSVWLAQCMKDWLFHSDLCPIIGSLPKSWGIPKFKVQRFFWIREHDELPFQPFECPGEFEPRRPHWYNDAWHNNPSVPPTLFPGNHTAWTIAYRALLPNHIALGVAVQQAE